MALATGQRGEVVITVSPEDTAAALGSGDVPVLGTPRLLLRLDFRQRPRRQRGLRFSRNDCMPSRASGVWLVPAMTSMA